jgi:hypothetical protein
MGSVVVLLEDWARKWLKRMLLTSGPFSLKYHKKPIKNTENIIWEIMKCTVLFRPEYLKVFSRGMMMMP